MSTTPQPESQHARPSYERHPPSPPPGDRSAVSTPPVPSSGRHSPAPPTHPSHAIHPHGSPYPYDPRAYGGYMYAPPPPPSNGHGHAYPHDERYGPPPPMPYGYPLPPPPFGYYGLPPPNASPGTPAHASQSVARPRGTGSASASPRPVLPPAPPGSISYTDDAATKLTDTVRRRCFNCRTTEASTWRRSNLSAGKVLCNKCGLYERTHSCARPEQFTQQKRAGSRTTTDSTEPSSLAHHPQSQSSPAPTAPSHAHQNDASNGEASHYTYSHGLPYQHPLAAYQQQQQQQQHQSPTPTPTPTQNNGVSTPHPGPDAAKPSSTNGERTNANGVNGHAHAHANIPGPAFMAWAPPSSLSSGGAVELDSNVRGSAESDARAESSGVNGKKRLREEDVDSRDGEGEGEGEGDAEGEKVEVKKARLDDVPVEEGKEEVVRDRETERVEV